MPKNKKCPAPSVSKKTTGNLSTRMSADAESRARVLLEADEIEQQGGGGEFHRRYWQTLIK